MKNNKILIYYAFFFIYQELIFKTFIIGNTFSTNTLSIILFTLPIILLITLINTLINKKILTYIITILLTILYMGQYVYYNFYSSVFSIHSAILGAKQVLGGFSDAIILMIIRKWYVMLLMLLPLIILIIYNKKLKINKNKINIILNTLYLVISIISVILMIKIDNKSTYSINTLYTKTNAPMLTINKVGLISMEVLDLYRCITNFEDTLSTSSSITEELDEYFNSVDTTSTNRYTGLFKGKNLIFITAESFDSILIDKDLTPTLYELYTGSIKFNNYYQPLYPISTNDGEYMNLTSLIPEEGNWSMYDSANIYMPYTLGNVFNNLNYNKVLAYHNNNYKFYRRDLSYPNYGFEYVGCGNGLEYKMNCKVWPESDKEMITSTYEDYISSESFMVYYLTVSGHLTYKTYWNDMVEKNYDKVKDLKYSSNVKGYLSANLELEYALEELMNKLKENNKLDDTVIVIVPDHYPYGLSCKELNEISDTDRCDKFENYHTTAIIYNKNLTSNIEVNKYVSGLDILPTLLNLYGVEYDSRLLMGTDALSNSNGLVILSDRSFISEYGKYNSLTNTFTSFTKDLPNNYLSDTIENINNKFSVSSLLLSKNNNKYTDYYRSLTNEIRSE